MSSLNIRQHHPVQVEYWASEEAVSDPAPLKVAYSISLGPNTDNPLDWRVALTVNFSGISPKKKETVKGTVTFVGYFDVSADTPKTERENFVARNGASVLYSAVRELLANISCRSSNRRVLLPLTSFHDITINPDAPKAQIEAQT